LERLEPLYWSMRLRPYGRQRMSVELNGQPVVPTRRLHGWETVVAPLPVELLRADNRLVLRLPDARSPKSVGYSGDTRVLGIETEWVQIGHHRYPAGEPAYGIRSTRGHKASIRFGLDEVRPLVLGLEVETVGRQRLTVELNGVRLWEGTGDGAWVKGALSLPAAALRPDNEIVFLLPDAHSPKSVGLGQDERVLGLAARWIRFDPGAP